MSIYRRPQRPDPINKSGTAAEAVRREQQKELAKGRLDRAYQLKVDGNDEGARLALAEAVRTDASLVTSPAAVSLAQALTGQPRDKAIVALLQHSETAVVLSRRPVFTITPDGYGFGLELALLPLMCILFLAALTPAYSLLVIGQTGFGSKAIGLVATGVWPYVGAGIGLAVWIVVDVIAAYIIGTILGGSGSLVRFARRLIRAATIWIVLMTIAVVIALIGMTGSGLSNTSAGIELHLSVLVTVCAWVVEAAILIGPILFGGIAGRAHEMGWIKGALAINLSSATLGIVAVLMLGSAHFQ
ncbi:MAG: hypothetical protein ACYDBJ_09265 [Aggregatilineales bacterium]